MTSVVVSKMRGQRVDMVDLPVVGRASMGGDAAMSDIHHSVYVPRSVCVPLDKYVDEDGVGNVR